MMTLSEAKAIYKTGGGHFFDRETFKYWGSRIESALYKNRCFVTSENNFDGSRRAYTVRRFSPDFLHIEYSEIGLHYYKFDTLIKFFENFKHENGTKKALITFSKNHCLQCEPVRD